MKPEILLFHPPNAFNPKLSRHAILSQLLCGYGLLHIGSLLKERGYNVECWNIPLAYHIGYNNDDLINHLKNYDPLIVGIELNWLHSSKGALVLAEVLKNLFSSTPLIIGGVHSTLFAEQAIRNKAVDIVVKGEGEKIIEEIVNKIERNKDFSTVKGTIVKKNGRIIKNDGKNIFENIDEIPPYDFSFLKPKTKIPYNSGAINTCRGPCKYDCIYCIGAHSCYLLSPRSKTIFHSVNWIITQIRKLLESVNRICIQDYSFSNPKFIFKLAKEIQKEHLQDLIEIFDYAIVPTSHITSELIQELARAGVNFFDLGLESGSDNILHLLKRPYNTKQALKVVKNAIKNRITPLTYWMITGLEQKADLSQTKIFLRDTMELGAIPRWITPLCIIPYTQIFKRAQHYHINLKLSTFEDFMNFSTEIYNKNAYYPRCITHESNLMDVEAILRAVADLKSYIIKHQDLILKSEKMSSKLMQRNFQLSNIPNKTLNFIKSTFF
ncbi:MAG: B12-binding domain-containing radical SAM protein [Candidatus Helarchaeota archaeon]